MTDTPRRIAAFDFDGTLTDRDTLVPFLMKVSGAVKFAATTARLGALGAIGRVPIRDRDRVKELMLRDLLGGRSESELRSSGHEYASRILQTRMNQSVLDRLRDHVQQGHEVLLVSASLVYYLDPIAELLGINAVIAVEPQTVDGVLDGSLRYPNVRAEQKAIRLSEWLGGTDSQHGSDSGSNSTSTELWAYGNSSGDHQLLAMADHAFWLGSPKKRPAGVDQFRAQPLDA